MGGSSTPLRAAAEETQRAPIPRGARARERVLRAALEVLADHGMPGFTMEAIAHRAGASKATVYRHWASPAALLVDAMDMSFQPLPLPATGQLRRVYDAAAYSGLAEELADRCVRGRAGRDADRRQNAVCVVAGDLDALTLRRPVQGGCARRSAWNWPPATPSRCAPWSPTNHPSSSCCPTGSSSPLGRLSASRNASLSTGRRV